METPESPEVMVAAARYHEERGALEDALYAYERRAARGDMGVDVWYARYRIGALRERLGQPWSAALDAYLAAYQSDPTRAEPLYRIGVHYQEAGEYALAHLFLARAVALPAPDSPAEQAIYDSYGPMQYAISCYYIGAHAEAIRANNALLRGRRLDPQLREQVARNRRFSLDAIHPPSPAPLVAPGRIILCIPCHDPATTLYDCLHSILIQTCTNFTVALLDCGEPRASDMLPDGDPRFRVVRCGATTDWCACIARFLSEECNAEDIVLLVSPDERMAHAGVLGTIRTAFRDPDCRAAYGQYQRATGQIGNAEPAPDVDIFVRAGAALRERSTIAFRAEIGAGALAGQTAPDLAAVMQRVQQAAGFHYTRFLDETITIVPAPAPHPPSIAPVHPPISPDTRPLVSCLMVTHDRLPLAEQSIRCYGGQTYPHRELIIVTTGGAYVRQALERFIEREHIPNVRIVPCDDSDAPLGGLRNRSLDAAMGDIVCQWDDDDLYHPARLAVQLDRMLEAGARACCLTDHLQFIGPTHSLGWTDWTVGGVYEGIDTLLPGTLMMYRDGRFRYPEAGEYARRGEDTALLYDLHPAVPIASLSGKGFLYVYRYHGGNTHSHDHHARMLASSMPVDTLRRHEGELRDMLRYYPLARPLTVVGLDGPAFVVQD